MILAAVQEVQPCSERPSKRQVFFGDARAVDLDEVLNCLTPTALMKCVFAECSMLREVCSYCARAPSNTLQLQKRACVGNWAEAFVMDISLLCHFVSAAVVLRSLAGTQRSRVGQAKAVSAAKKAVSAPGGYANTNPDWARAPPAQLADCRQRQVCDGRSWPLCRAMVVFLTRGVRGGRAALCAGVNAVLHSCASWLAQVDDWEGQPAGPVSNRLRVAARHDCDSLSIVLITNSASGDAAAETPIHADGTEAKNVAFALSPEVWPPQTFSSQPKCTCD